MRSRRRGAPDSMKRAQFLDAAEQLMLEEGYAAVTTRRVGEKAGLSPQLVHYYFRSIDDLFLEIFRRRAEEGLERFTKALSKNYSLLTLWKFSADPPGPAFNLEFAALANHRKVIRTEIARYAKRYRRMQLDAISRLLADRGIAADTCPRVAVLLAMTGISHIMSLERALGFRTGHGETVAFIERSIDRIERAGPSPPRASTRRRASRTRS